MVQALETATSTVTNRAIGVPLNRVAPRVREGQALWSSLNATGLFIWKHCDGKKNNLAIVKALKEAFAEVPEMEIETQVNDFLDEMKTTGFIGKVLDNK
jgi:hypothetical protein